MICKLTEWLSRPGARRAATAPALVLAFALAGPGPAVGAAAVNVPGTRVSLMPPEGFELSRDFSGFANPASGSSIVVTEMPAGAFAQVSTAFTPGTRFRGMAISARDELTVDGHPGFLIEATQEAGQTTFQKWVLIFGATDFTGMIAMSVPQLTERAESGEVAVAALRSTEVLQAARVDPRESLPFSFAEAGRFSPDRVLQGNTVSLKEPPPSGSLFVITAPPNEACDKLDGGRELLSRTLLESIDGVDVAAVRWSAELVVDGLEGLESRAEGVDDVSGRKTLIYQAILFDDCRYYRFVGTAPLEQASAYLADFQAMTRSFARR